LGPGERKAEPDEDALHHVTTHRSCMGKEVAEQECVDEEIEAYHPVERRQKKVCSAHYNFIAFGSKRM
jgi:hypothetical protein